jgi:HPr kinase/phosphorylase
LSRSALHGSGLVVYDSGVLLLGDSGTGKTDASIQMIDRGHKLISDDLVDYDNISPDGITLYSIEPVLVYIRNIGIINVQNTYGDSALCKHHILSFVILLTSDEIAENSTISISGVDFPLYVLYNRRNIPLLIEAIIKA